MSLRVSGKHMDIGDAFRIRIEDRVRDAVSKYYEGGYSGTITVVKSGSRFSTDCTLHLDTGATLQSSAEAQDPQFSFDAAAEKMDTRLRRYMRRLKSRSLVQSARNNQQNIAYSVMEPAPDEDEDLPEDYAPTIVAESSVSLRTLSVASAVFELDLTEHPVLVFRNAGSEEVNIVYRRPDGNIGWIDPSKAAQAARA
ncbi:ribosome-associated translation inhibitor RaiA [Bacillus subtilis]|jgi:ribosomal subunit interface protein|uniref:ribosome hibernation-promoting factor, HPF/YfiA family n=1 Tax=Pseudochrobactrum asaccharolyticum TaxID=354351 RepID=UPI000EFB717D|nr:ribosome-associated translation inhibitor RaiA [Pseudochrobactrum asaccharolyticum]MBX8801127.1 ribosome-associated translation inhibitor RaiA [Ochrobactrum sp. MR28]MBX8816453.1 ribosome-associated translation inhibitor RaiA [Ochrobactrum sp. MR31]MCF7670412.1 ribosome-associated translation inhibitor RaiA [Bacillus subtilis]MDR2311604.1 ribosome-associated translation inhibitor RaiA [Brucellaceae bacterium]MCF7644349.1 ribosome-associated translation inhibitor RaiA [Pseudochrobactrum asac